MKKQPFVDTSMFDDPVPDPYLEFDDEVYESYLAQGRSPQDFDFVEARSYKRWLDKQPKTNLAE